jgi:predicted MPP superfamily phosphohydrolase
MSARVIRNLFALLALCSFVGGLIVAWRARFVAPYRAQVAHVVVQLPRKHGNLAGLTIVFVTDTHVGPYFAASDLEPVIERLEHIQPDIVLFGGDAICESPRFLKHTTPVLARMAKTARYGAWGVLGNHDIANTRERVVPALESAGIAVLENQAICVETDRGPLWIVGIADALLGKPDLNRAFGAVPAEAAAICLWHEPDLAGEAAPYGAFLQLSGHTHGGQVRLPGIGPIATPTLGKRFVQGRYAIGDMELYVSPGLGVYRPPVRLNCPPELTVIRLID